MDSVRFIILNKAANRPKEWRKGQAVFNYAYELYPEEATKLRGTELDPFYNDNRIDDFLVAMAKELGQMKK